ncbi:hypothetical protein FC83_GL002390 [Agrilactobacillus composti DSM 18527 = JCM 14202]|uniref:DegV family protein n=1 Tax=Agrilactobacillus composti DSM 18527 = JCM 14202 TaxID=1423734 RepID=X0QRW8_9LACO|nr:DegV family protein [Agrilactobacillus composti]KRM36518.1 hypothetical protein FC83_GL002390 [Agrilactobacillus composti DSM 18527 = JCM 14202]GAF41375.1 DegV family protein [Agrilactobacillus composti DSM 18527 = JCM 14202]
MKLAIVTDSTAYLSAEQIKANDIHVIPIPFMVDGQSYQEGKDISTAEFYKLLKTSKTFPTTSQPALGTAKKLYEQLHEAGYDTILSIHLASSISGFVDNLRLLENTISGVKLIPYDSQITVMLMGHLVLEAARMNRNHADLDAILARLNEMRASMGEVFIVNDLQNLVRGGRLSNASALVGTVLKIKPLLTFDPDTHKIVAFEKVRSIKRAYARAEELLQQAITTHDYPLRALIIHGDDLPEAKIWQQGIQSRFPELPTEITYFGPVVGVHLGDKAMALAWIRVYND